VHRNSQHRNLLTVISATSPLPFRHLRLSNVFERISRPSCEPFYATETSINRKYFFMNTLCIKYCCPQESTIEHCSSVVYISSTVAILTTKTSLWTCACASATQTLIKLLLLPSDTHRKSIKSITGGLLPFVTYLLTFPRNTIQKICFTASSSQLFSNIVVLSTSPWPLPALLPTTALHRVICSKNSSITV
jgi:hypothetical protein